MASTTSSSSPRARSRRVAPPWLAAIGRAWGRARARVGMEAAARGVAEQVILAAQATWIESEEILDRAWTALGAEAFERAMRASAWIHESGVVGPCEAAAMIRSSRWASRLADLAPESAWAARSHARSAALWREKEGSLERSGAALGSVGPLMRACASNADDWGRVFDAVAPRCPPPSRQEALACLALIGDASQRAAKFAAWIEAARIAECVDAPAESLATARRVRL